MQDYNNFGVIQSEIERGLVRGHQVKHDPDGLSQYYMWDEAFGGPSLMDRIRGLVRFFPSRKTRTKLVATRKGATECLPQAQ